MGHIQRVKAWITDRKKHKGAYSLLLALHPGILAHFPCLERFPLFHYFSECRTAGTRPQRICLSLTRALPLARFPLPLRLDSLSPPFSSSSIVYLVQVGAIPGFHASSSATEARGRLRRGDKDRWSEAKRASKRRKKKRKTKQREVRKKERARVGTIV